MFQKGFYCPQCDVFIGESMTTRQLYVHNHRLVSFCPKCNYDLLSDVMLLVQHSVEIYSEKVSSSSISPSSGVSSSRP